MSYRNSVSEYKDNSNTKRTPTVQKSPQGYVLDETSLMKPLAGVGVLIFPQCTDTVGLVTRTASSLFVINMCHLITRSPSKRHKTNESGF